MQKVTSLKELVIDDSQFSEIEDSEPEAVEIKNEKH